MSKIIERLSESDLNHLYEYNIDKLILRWEETNSIYYKIPKELIINEFYVNEWNYASKDRGGVVYSNQLTKYLKWVCEITPQELFDLCILHINDTDLRPKCSNIYCNKFLPWSGRFCWGYTTGHVNWHEGAKFCSPHCSAKYYSYTGVTGFGTVSNQASAEYSVWMSMGDPTDLCYFYIATTPTKLLKFGVTKDIQSRLDWSPKSRYINYKIINSGTREFIGLLEYWTKIELNSIYESLEFSESSKFREAYLKSLKRLELTNQVN